MTTIEVRQLIYDAISPLCPVSFQTYTGTKKVYVTYLIYLEQGEGWADDKEFLTGFYVQVDLWHKAPITDQYDNLASQIKDAMELAGFEGYSAQDFYENDTQIYHKSMRFNLVD